MLFVKNLIIAKTTPYCAGSYGTGCQTYGFEGKDKHTDDSELTEWALTSCCAIIVLVPALTCGKWKLNRDSLTHSVTGLDCCKSASTSRSLIIGTESHYGVADAG